MNVRLLLADELAIPLPALTVRHGGWAVDLLPNSWGRWRNTRRWGYLTIREWQCGPLLIMDVKISA
ncbi:hypothetical protein [Capillimicrobium parvum]|uniref:Uncharacterized protein n=1 Tax=Capillimicrobium parvum TaxID=2884022 RepID=A0A9E6XU80_9ACTN|nr:hypothetical protein [Capillimicrobium parvum]UGS34533.1 hypothetical protein DSM104329_00911 [Capillimicrobium parvum]